MEFRKFKEAVAKQFSTMKNYELFRTQVEKDQLWDTYLSSFPEGSNPVYRERTEHDCNCCKQFIRAIGNVVAIVDNKLVSIWDCQVNDSAYQTVANAMAGLVKSKPIENIFLHTENTAGTDKSYDTNPDSTVTTWEHFFVNIPNGRNGEKNFVMKGADIGTTLSESRALHDVLCRSLTELTNDSINTVRDLIAQNSLYRGEEHKFVITEFQKLKHEFNKLPEKYRDNFVWLKSRSIPSSVAKIRNTAIGTLLVDLSEDVDLEAAVKSFESKVAPANYKRPTALVTKAMVENAKNKIEELGLTSALERRYATITDININDILFADREAKQNISGNVFDEIASKVSDKKTKNMDKVEEITIDKFISNVLPNANSIEIMVENTHIPNLVSLVAPVDHTANPLFKWDNNFSWSYNGDMADSIKERVKKAGGNVTGDLCCRLAWFNRDDLDFHMQEPGEYEIYFGNRNSISPCGGRLDVDMNVHGETREPVENIFYNNRNTMKEGTYKLQVHNFYKRETSDIGFEVEVDFMGNTHRFVYDRPVKHGETVTVLEFSYSKKDGIKIIKSLPSTKLSKTVWNIQTEQFHKVNVLMLSPNYWGEKGVGNKHYFFMIDGCMNDGSARGFFNEFLKEELNIHRKVFEIVGNKMKTQESDNQLSGLGFSSTQRNSVLCRVNGSFNRVVKILF
jgi:hypothetical protein